MKEVSGKKVAPRSCFTIISDAPYMCFDKRDTHELSRIHAALRHALSSALLSVSVASSRASGGAGTGESEIRGEAMSEEN